MTTAIETQTRRLPWLKLISWGLGLTIGGSIFIFANRSGSQIAAVRALGKPLHFPDLTLLAAPPLAMQVHIVAIALAVPLGAVMMLSRKGARFHRIAGWTWVSLMAIAALAPLFALGEPHYGWNYIHLTIPLVLIILIPAVIAARRHQVRRHRNGMIWLYVILLWAGAGTLAPSRLIWRMFFG